MQWYRLSENNIRRGVCVLGGVLPKSLGLPFLDHREMIFTPNAVQTGYAAPGYLP